MRFGVAILTSLLAAFSAAGESSVTPHHVSTRGGTTVYIRSDETIGCYGVCDAPQVLFDGVRSSGVTVIGPNQVSAVTPPHAAEAIVPVVVVAAGRQIPIRGSLAYEIDRDRVLVPLFFPPTPGFGGSMWSTELWAHNSALSDATLSSTICDDFALGLHACFEAPEVIPAASARRLYPPASYAGSLGIYYSVPHHLADLVTFDLRLTDLAHPAAGETSVPVTYAYRMRENVVLLNVPTGSDSRKLLRIYSGQGGYDVYDVFVFDLESGLPLATKRLSLVYPTDLGGPNAWAAADSAIFDQPAVRRAGKVGVSIRPVYPGTLWAMVSVTDNATQHVTVITPMP